MHLRGDPGPFGTARLLEGRLDQRAAAAHDQSPAHSAGSDHRPEQEAACGPHRLVGEQQCAAGRRGDIEHHQNRGRSPWPVGGEREDADDGRAGRERRDRRRHERERRHRHGRPPAPPNRHRCRQADDVVAVGPHRRAHVRSRRGGTADDHGDDDRGGITTVRLEEARGSREPHRGHEVRVERDNSKGHGQRQIPTLVRAVPTEVGWTPKATVRFRARGVRNETSPARRRHGLVDRVRPCPHPGRRPTGEQAAVRRRADLGPLRSPALAVVVDHRRRRDRHGRPCPRCARSPQPTRSPGCVGACDRQVRRSFRSSPCCS